MGPHPSLSLLHTLLNFTQPLPRHTPTFPVAHTPSDVTVAHLHVSHPATASLESHPHSFLVIYPHQLLLVPPHPGHSCVTHTELPSSHPQGLSWLIPRAGPFGSPHTPPCMSHRPSHSCVTLFHSPLWGDMHTLVTHTLPRVSNMKPSPFHFLHTQTHTHTLLPVISMIPNVTHPGLTGLTRIHMNTHTHLSRPHILSLSFPHPPFPPCHPTHPPSLSPAQSRPWPTHASLGRNPGSGHPQGGSGSTGLLSSFPSPRQDTPAWEHPCPETVTSHPPQGHRDTRSEGPTPPILCAPPRTLTTPSPSDPLIADKAPGPRARGERGKGAGSLPNSPLLSSLGRGALPLP